jgi:hypothetical protein
MYLKNFDKLLAEYMMSHPRRRKSSALYKYFPHLKAEMGVSL